MSFCGLLLLIKHTALYLLRLFMVVLIFREYHYQFLACENKKKGQNWVFGQLCHSKCTLKEFKVNPNSKFEKVLRELLCSTENRKNNFGIEASLISLAFTIADKVSINFLNLYLGLR